MPLANMEEIYQAHARTVYKFLLSQCHDADLAEELTQETFYQAVRSIDRFNGSCKVSVCPPAPGRWCTSGPSGASASGRSGTCWDGRRPGPG